MQSTREWKGAGLRGAWLLRAVPTVVLGAAVVWAVAITAPAGAQQAPAQQQQGSRLPPEVRLLPNDQLGRLLATERNPLVRDAIVTELKGRGEAFFENRSTSPFAGGKVDIPLGRGYGLSLQGGVNDQGGVAAGGGGFLGLPGAPSVGTVKPRPDGFNVNGEITVSLGKDTSVTAKGSFNVSPDGQLSGTAGGKLEMKGPDGRSFSVGANVELKDGQVTVTTENGTKLASGNGSSVSLDPATVDDKGNFETKGSINLPNPQGAEQGPWGERVPSVTMKGTITLDKSYSTFTEFLQGIGVLKKPGTPTQEEFQKALDGWAESMRQRHEQAQQAEQRRLQELEQLQKQQQEQQQQQQEQQQQQQPQDQQSQQDQSQQENQSQQPGQQDQQQPASQNQSQEQPGEQNQQPEQQAPTVLVPDGNQPTDPGSSGNGQAPSTPPAGDGQTPTTPSSGAPEVANSGTNGSTGDASATGALASEMAGTDYTGAFDSGGTADYSGSNTGTAVSGGTADYSGSSGVSNGTSADASGGVSGGAPASSAGSTDFGADSGYGGDYTGTYDSGGTADYSGGYATDFGAGDASCACF